MFMSVRIRGEVRVRRLATECSTSSLHTPEFDVDQACMPLGVRAIATSVWYYLERHQSV